MKLGTYTTFDCPTKELEKAYEWLQTKFGKIGGTVRKVINPHDFGSYPSFEIDYPEMLEFIDTDEEYKDEDSQQLVEKKDDWHDKANDIEAKYCKKFEAYL